MTREGHGSSQSNCHDCYGIAVSGGRDHLSYSLKVTGKAEFQGFLLYVQDESNNTVGTFSSYDRGMFLPVECQEAVEWDLENTIGHANPALKRWPVEFGWAAAATEEEVSKIQPGDKMTVRGMVVVSMMPRSNVVCMRSRYLSQQFYFFWQIDYDNWHILPEFSFSIAKPAAKETESHLPEVALFQGHHHEHPNKLFYTVLVIAFIIYNGMSLLHRTLQKQRRQKRCDQSKFQGTDDSSILLRDW
jgi:hypothetical protein